MMVLLVVLFTVIACGLFALCYSMQGTTEDNPVPLIALVLVTAVTTCAVITAVNDQKQLMPHQLESRIVTNQEETK